MSSSKKIHSRLNKLFIKIKENYQIETPDGEAKETRVPTFVVEPASEHMESLSQKKASSQTVLEFSSAGEPSASSNILTIPFQTGREWKLIQLEYGSQQTWKEEDQNLVKQIVDQLGLALQNTFFMAETQKTVQRLASIVRITSRISSSLDLQSLLESAVHLTQQCFGLYHAHIFLFDNNEHFLSVEACGWESGQPQRLHEKLIIGIDDKLSIVAKSAREKLPVLANNVHEYASWVSNPMLPKIQAEMAVPIIIGNHVLGVLSAHSDHVNYFSEADLAFMTTLATQIGLAIQNIQMPNENQKRTVQLT
jgi:GAF domain-containing protein